MTTPKFVPTGKDRRTVGQIDEYLTPREIYELIHIGKWPYKTMAPFFHLRDRAYMAGLLISGGRNHEWLLTRKRMFTIKEGLLVCKGMHVGKRTKKTIEKHGEHITKRPPLAWPLQEDLFKNPRWNELIPFALIVYDHLRQLEDPYSRLFEFNTTRGWQIVKYCTDMFPNWFRAQCEMIMGGILEDSVKLAKFIGVVKPDQVAHYIGYDYRQGLKTGNKEDELWYKEYLRDHIDPILKRPHRASET